MNHQDKDRSQFVHPSRYGTTSDIYTLPVGTTFHVVNGQWDGRIEEQDGKKVLRIDGDDKVMPIEPDRDYEMVLRITQMPVSRDLYLVTCSACDWETHAKLDREPKDGDVFLCTSCKNKERDDLIAW